MEIEPWGPSPGAKQLQWVKEEKQAVDRRPKPLATSTLLGHLHGRGQCVLVGSVGVLTEFPIKEGRAEL